jgi:hypothetical protein
MDRFSISLNKKVPPVFENLVSRCLRGEPQKDLCGSDPDLPPKGIPYRVITQSLENLEMDHSMYMEAIRTAANFSNGAGSLGEKLFSVRLIMNGITDKFEIQLVFVKK